MRNVFIVLGTYQGEAYLPALLASIQQQSCPTWTLLARDDASSDATPAILRAAAAADHRIVVLDGDGVRHGAVGNFGLLMQQAYDRGAEYLFFADQDDVWHPDKIAKQMQCMQEAEDAAGTRSPQLVYSDLVVVDASLRSLHPSFLRYSRLPYASGRPLRSLLGRSFVLGCATVINRPLLDFALPLPTAVASHDWWVALCAACVGSISLLDTPTLEYRRHAHNASLPAYWTTWNPFRRAWRQQWDRRWTSFRRSLEQARVLRDRLQQRRLDAAELLDRFCGLFENPGGPWRRIGDLHRLGIPAIDLPRRLLYYLCVLMLSGHPI
jgi:glycosyltransferase involved in cell wall biosynthesis